MLVNLTPDIQEIARRKVIAKENNFEYIPQSDPKWLQETGIYQSSFPFNFPDDEFIEELNGYNYNHLKLKAGETILQYYSKNKYIEQYGVADNIEQIKKFYKKQIKSKTEKFVITLTPICQDKENKGKGGGWRWHKWGRYIGDFIPQCEHLDDEEFGDDFKYIICFHMYYVS